MKMTHRIEQVNPNLAEQERPGEEVHYDERFSENKGNCCNEGYRNDLSYTRIRDCYQPKGPLTNARRAT